DQAARHGALPGARRSDGGGAGTGRRRLRHAGLARRLAAAARAGRRRRPPQGPLLQPSRHHLRRLVGSAAQHTRQAGAGTMTTDADTIAMLRDSATRYAADHYSFLQRRAALDDPHGYSERAWRDYAQFGWLALRLPEADGGIAADPAAIGAVMEVV